MIAMFHAGLLLHIGPRYLPPAVTLSLYAAANVVVISFVPTVLFAGDRPRTPRTPGSPRLPAPWLLAAGRSAAVRVVGGVVGVAGLVVAGLTGGSAAWTGFWVGALVCALVGNLWTVLNPWAALYDLLVRFRRPTPRFTLPARLGTWPAVVVYLGFALVCLAPAAGPPWLPAALAGYTALTLAGMVLFGRDAWLSRSEAFTVLLDVAGRFGPVEVERDAEGRPAAVRLRPWGTGLLGSRDSGWDRAVFLVVVLSTLAFDGLLATAAWRDVAAATSPALGSAVVRTAGLLLTAGAFLLAFALLARLMLWIAGVRSDDGTAVTTLALTLVPIGLLYGAAHLYGTLFARPRPGIVLTEAATTWFLQLTLVVIGHAIAVHLAHRSAGERFRSAQRAVLSQYPVLVLMVVYTMTSLWILAQPAMDSLS